MSFEKNSAFRDRQPPSPFRYASKYDKLDLHAKLPSPEQGGVHSRHAIRPRSLAQSYRDASRQVMATADAESASVTTPSPRQQRQPRNAFAPYQISPPPFELQDAYKRIQEDEMLLSDYVRDDDSDRQRIARRPSSRSHQASSQANETNSDREIANGHPNFNMDFGGDLGDYRNQKSRDYTKDEERLKRATGQPSPVFSKAQVGRDASRADSWRRRKEAEAEVDNDVPENDGNLGPSGPSPNLPSGWGYRAGHRQEWERKFSPPTAPQQQEEQTVNGRWSGPTMRTASDPPSKPTRTSAHSPARHSLQARNALEERIANFSKQTTQEGLGIKETRPVIDSVPNGGEQIPNSPITIYKNSSFTRPSPSKRDSRDLLRSLSRAETHKAEQVQTPEPAKLFERKVYDKTPRVTGAWIDTPVTQRVAEKVELPEDLTKDIVLPRATKETKETAPPTQPIDKTASKMEEPKPVQNAEEKHLPHPQADKEKTSRPPLPRPHLPKSALETVIEDASSGKDIDFGDDTIESLQAIMDGPSEVKAEEQEDDEAYEQAVLASLEKADSKRTDGVNFNSLNVKLNSLMKHINEVKRGLDGLEDHVKRDVEISSQPNSPIKATSPTHLHTGETCKGCGTNSDGRVYAAVQIPRLLERSPRSQRLRPTKLFWFIVIPLCWWVIECLMTDQFSHPDISETCEGYCLRPDAPVYPWVTVTMLWRWSHLSTIVTPILAIVVAFSKLVTQLFGFSDGYVDDLPELRDIVGEIRINGTPVAFPWLSAPTAANIEPQIPQPQLQQPSQVEQPPQPAKHMLWPPPNAYIPRRDSDMASMEEVMDADEYL
jgi:hypothetical protein